MRRRRRRSSDGDRMPKGEKGGGIYTKCKEQRAEETRRIETAAPIASLGARRAYRNCEMASRDARHAHVKSHCLG